MKEGEDYLVKDKEKIIPLLPKTGYQETGKKFSPLVEIFLHIKHGLELPKKVTEEIDRLSTFDFYQKFKRICGFTGTSSTVARRLFEGYGLGTTLIPPYYKSTRDESFLFLNNWQDKLIKIQEVVENKNDRRNILIVFSDFNEDQELLRRLHDSDIEIRFLSVANQEDDFELYQWISSSSPKKRVLVTVKMMSRGVDLKPDEEVKKKGFLLLAATPFEYERSLLQLLGRVGRRGEKTEVRVFISDDDAVFANLSEEDKKRLEEFFKNPEKYQKQIITMIKKVWEKKEDEITIRFKWKKLLFLPLINLRDYVEREEKSFPQIKRWWIKYGVTWMEEIHSNFVFLPWVIEKKFKEF